MSEQDLSSQGRDDEIDENEDDVHPLKKGIEEAKNGESVSLDDILSQLE